MREGKGVYLKRREIGEELGGVEGGKTIIKTYDMRKESIFNFLKKTNSSKY